MDFIVSTAPIVILIYLMTKKNSVPSPVALPAVALLTYGLKLIYFAAAPDLIHASVLDGLLSAWTPILIIWGAIFLFKTMEHSDSNEHFSLRLSTESLPWLQGSCSKSLKCNFTEIKEKDHGLSS